jgi:hypothetical protein
MPKWNELPQDKAKLWLNKSLELQIILACNWHCIACDQGSQFSSFDFVKRGTMTLDQVRHFIGEMKSANTYIGRIRILGGEPTVHPKFKEIVELLHSELVPSHVGQLEVITNGSHPERIQSVRHLIKPRVSREEAKQSAHVANLINTPASLGYEGRMCNAPWHCGISLNAYGYFPCSSGAGIARFEDWMKWQRLKLPTCVKPCNAVRETWPELQELCNHCYHGLRDEDKVRCGTSNPANNVPGAHIKTKMDEWRKGKKAVWEVYGGSQ